MFVFMWREDEKLRSTDARDADVRLTCDNFIRNEHIKLVGLYMGDVCTLI